MSFIQSWGYASVDDVNQPLTDDDRIFSICNSFIIDFEYNEDFLSQCYDCNGRDLKHYRITSDYEAVSTFLACRFITREGSCAYPSYDSPTIICVGRNANSTKLIQRCSEVTKLEFSSSSNKSFDFEQLLLFSFQHALLETGFHSFATYEQQHNVAAKLSEEKKILHVCTLKHCTYGEQAGRGQLFFEIDLHRINPARVSQLLHDYDGDADHNNDKMQREVLFLPRNESCFLHSAWSVHSKSSGDNFLTEYEINNRKHGFIQYAPSGYAQYQQYWSLAYGINEQLLTSMNETSMVAHVSSDRMKHCVVPLQSLSYGIVPLIKRSDDKRDYREGAESVFNSIVTYFEAVRHKFQMKLRVTKCTSTKDASDANRKIIAEVENQSFICSALKQYSGSFTTGRVMKRLSHSDTCVDVDVEMMVKSYSPHKLREHNAITKPVLPLEFDTKENDLFEDGFLDEERVMKVKNSDRKRKMKNIANKSTKRLRSKNESTF